MTNQKPRSGDLGGAENRGENVTRKTMEKNIWIRDISH
jgi:hypothetical protein